MGESLKELGRRLQQRAALCLKDDLPISVLGLGTSMFAVLLDESEYVKTNPAK